MVCNCNYNKTKVMYELMKMSHFIEKHGIHDSEKDGHPLCTEEFKEIKHDIDRHVEKLRTAIEGLSREMKFG